MKNINFVIAAILIMVTFSCNHTKKDSKEYFKQVFNLKSHKLNVDVYKINSFGRIVPFENEQCLIKENYIGESFLDKIYYTKDSVYPFAKIGSGPDEYLMPRIMQKKDQSSIMILDVQRQQIITKELNGRVSDVMDLKCMPLSIIQTKDKYVISGLMDRNANDDKRYAILNSKGEYIKSFGDFPNDNIDGGVKSKVFAYQDFIVYNPVLNRFATVCFSGAIFELYQMDTIPYIIKSYHDIYPVYINDSGPGYNSIKHGKDNIMGYTDIYATNRYIYTLYSGKKLSKHSNEGMMDAKLTNNILVYDWEGKCVCRLVTDVKLSNLCITDNDQELIALGWENDFYLYSFDLSNIVTQF